MGRADAWRSYAAGSELDHFAKFCREHLIQSEDRWEGKPLVLEPWQRKMMGEALAFDAAEARALRPKENPGNKSRGGYGPNDITVPVDYHPSGLT
jgi:hypothetical protein